MARYDDEQMNNGILRGITFAIIERHMACYWSAAAQHGTIYVGGRHGLRMSR